MFLFCNKGKIENCIVPSYKNMYIFMMYLYIHIHIHIYIKIWEILNQNP